MIFIPPLQPTVRPEVITLADGQTFTAMVIKPDFRQRFEDEGREVLAKSGQPDGWQNFRLGRLRSVVVDWQDVVSDKGQAIPFSFGRLLELMESSPEIVPQLMDLANLAFSISAVPAS